MRIGIFISELKEHGWKYQLRSFIVETLLSIPVENPKHHFLFIIENELSLTLDNSSNTQLIRLKPKTALFTKVRQGLELKQILKKAGLDLLVSVNNGQSYKLSIPHCIILTGTEKLRLGDIRKADAVVVLNKKEIKYLAENSIEKSSVIYPSPDKNFGPISLEEKQTVLDRYSGSAEYFLYNSNFNTQDDFVNLLKSFSQFKKRQQSSFKLLITGDPTPDFDSKLADYKYRNDVKFTGVGNGGKLIAAAYAVVLPFSTNEDILASLNAMRSGVPVIAPKDSIVSEISNGAILFAETNSIKDIADKMMQIYTDENNRSVLMQKGKAVAQNYTQEKAAKDMWQVILKALK